MAKGDIKWFSGALLAIGKKVHDLSADTFKLGLVTSTATPAIADADPRWAAGGSVNFATNQVTPGGNYATGGPSLASVSWTSVSNVPTFRATDLTINQHASNPTNARWAIIYNDTDASKRALAFVDLGAATDLTLGNFTIDWQAGAGTDILTLTQS
jgi:hypothetical protein